MPDLPCRPYLPPEWTAQSAVMLTWPHGHGDWGDTLEATEAVYREIVTHVLRFEACLVVCYDAAHRQHVAGLLKDCASDRLYLAIAPSNDVWARDHGPITVVCQGEPYLLNFHFNGWGGKYAYDLDEAITPTLYRHGVFGELPMEDTGLVLEGGGIEVDGSGTLMATRDSVLAATRNAELGQEEIEARLSHYFGIDRFIWLEHGHLAGDDTDGHIDTLARFCDRDTIAYCRCDDPEDEHYGPLKAMEAELTAARSITGQPYHLLPLPLPAPVYDDDGRRLPATYANFLIINDAVLLPAYKDPADAQAQATLQQAFPGREIIAIDCRALVAQNGSLHCASMQLPEGIRLHTVD